MDRGFPGGSVGEESPAKAGEAGDAGSIPASGRSLGEGHGNALQYSCLILHGQRSLAGYSPWCHKRVRHNLVTKQQQLDHRSYATFKIICFRLLG